MIKIVRKGNDAPHDYSVWVIISGSRAYEITVNRGLKPTRRTPDVRIPEMHISTPKEADLLQEGIKTAYMLLAGTLSVAETPDYKFTPSTR